jgi:hypothetical protein
VAAAEPLEVFVEVFAETDVGELGGTVVMVRGGHQFQLTENLFWGAGVGTGLRRGSPDVTATTGLTWLF